MLAFGQPRNFSSLILTLYYTVGLKCTTYHLPLRCLSIEYRLHRARINVSSMADQSRQVGLIGRHPLLAQNAAQFVTRSAPISPQILASCNEALCYFQDFEFMQKNEIFSSSTIVNRFGLLKTKKL